MDGTLVAVKKLDKVLPHGEKEFITEVNTIGSMHHMNLVRLCGYCSEGSHRYAFHCLLPTTTKYIYLLIMLFSGHVTPENPIQGHANHFIP